MKPNPKPREGTTIRRDLDCERTDDCLGRAATHGWLGLDCGSCLLARRLRVYEPEDVDIPEWMLPDLGEVRVPSVGKLSVVALQVLDAMREAGRPMTTPEVAAAVGRETKQTSWFMRTLRIQRHIRLVARGVYEVAR